MNCYVCDGPQVLIWGGDQDLEEDEDYKYVTNLSCPKCNSIVHVYWSDEKGIKNETCSNHTWTPWDRKNNNSS
jgi:hypothetical protein